MCPAYENHDTWRFGARHCSSAPDTAKKRELYTAEPLNPTLVQHRQRMSNIASQNTIAQFVSKLEAGLEGLRAELKSQRESQDAKMDAQNSKYNVLIWMIGFATVIISAVILFSNNSG